MSPEACVCGHELDEHDTESDRLDWPCRECSCPTYEES